MRGAVDGLAPVPAAHCAGAGTGAGAAAATMLVLVLDADVVRLVLEAFNRRNLRTSFACFPSVHSFHTRRARVVSLPPSHLYGAAARRAPTLGPGRALSLPCGWNHAGAPAAPGWERWKKAARRTRGVFAAVSATEQRGLWDLGSGGWAGPEPAADWD